MATTLGTSADRHTDSWSSSESHMVRMTINRATGSAPPEPIGRLEMKHVDSNSHLLAALRREDQTAAESLVARYGDRAYRLAIGITRNAQDAEEAVQDAFWSVIRKIDTFRGDSALGSWVYRIVVNAAYQKLRGRARRRGEISLEDVLPSFHEKGQQADPITDWSARVDDPALQIELRAALNKAIGELPAGYRALIVLRDMEGLSMVEVAAALGITVANAKTRTHRARLFLRKRLAHFFSDAAHSVAGPSQQERVLAATLAEGRVYPLASTGASK